MMSNPNNPGHYQAGGAKLHSAGRLIVFSRYPEPGRSKTRLIPVLGPDGAANLQGRMTERALAWARQVPQTQLEIRCEGSEDRMRAWLGRWAAVRPQGPGDLGQRMDHCLSRALAEGAGAALLFGCDIPGNTSHNLSQALEALKEADLVLGPARDGGYYLVGLKKPAPGLFRDMTWGHDQVFKQTLARAERLGLSYALVNRLRDVDYAKDLHAWYEAPLPPDAISVVIPTLNETRNLSAAMASLRGPLALEIIVVDGGSVDGTQELATRLGARLLEGPASRGGQLRLGCQKAKGDYILMLHADTRLQPGWHHKLRRILHKSRVAMGAFDFQLDASGPGYWLIEFMVALRSRLAQLPYGDQALFIRRDDLRRLGGVPDLPLMEDVELVKRSRRLGRVAVSRLAAVSSARRWHTKGVVRNTLFNWRCMLAYQLGAPPQELAHRYYGRK